MPRQAKYQRDINRGLDRAHASAGSLTVPLDALRLAVFSDQHKGVGDGADDFSQCEQAYLGALAHYLGEGYSLAVLGDVEELWENDAGSILGKYSNVLDVEQRYHQAGSYWRFYGNHDDDWANPDLVKQRLGPIFGEVRVWESLRLGVQRDGQTLGEIFMAHGHQGTTFSDRFGGLSRQVVRRIWRPIQRAFKIKLSTPSSDWRLRHSHDIAMYNWAVDKSRLILIAGHTHHAVFPSPRRIERLTSALEQLRGFASDSPEVLAARAELAAARAQEQPSYFNSGCCCYRDGQITGLELADGQIRLVQWKTSAGSLLRTILDEADLAQVLYETEGRAPPIFLEESRPWDRE